MYLTYVKVDGLHDDLIPSVILEQVGIGHVPAWLRFSSLGWGSPDTEPATRAHVDYVRVFQPENLYADMEPVYQ